MRLNFRQGIVQHQQPDFIFVNSTTVDLSVIDTPIIIAFADGDKDYLHIEQTPVLNAWTNIAPGIDQWLYWDLDQRTGARTFGVTIHQPFAQPTPPLTLVNDLHWFDTVSNTMLVWNSISARWIHKIRVFACKLDNGALPISVSINSPSSFSGTQIGNTTETFAGQLIFNTQTDRVIKTSDNKFVTTEDQLTVSGVATNQIKLAALVVTAEAQQNLASYTIVKFNGFNSIVHADEFTSSQGILFGIIQQAALVSNFVTVITQGAVTNDSWNWTIPGVNGFLYSDTTGQLTATPTYAAQVPVATVIDKKTILLATPTTTIVNTTVAGPVIGEATAGSQGLVRLNIPPVTPIDPVVVGNNDPRLTDARSALPHTHLSAEITDITTAINAGLSTKVNKAGDTMTGALVLSGPPTLPLHAVTKAYADSLTSTTTPGGTTTNIQVNDAGVLQGTSAFTFDSITGAFNLQPGIKSVAVLPINIYGASSSVSQSSTVDIRGGNGIGTKGGSITIRSGDTAITDATPTVLSLQGGNAIGAATKAVNVVAKAGAGSATADGGDFIALGGNGGLTTAAGMVIIGGGAAGPSGPAGDVLIQRSLSNAPIESGMEIQLKGTGIEFRQFNGVTPLFEIMSNGELQFDGLTSSVGHYLVSDGANGPPAWQQLAVQLSVLTDVGITAPVIGDVLTFNGVTWENSPSTGITFPILAPNSTVTAPSYSFATATNMGLRRVTSAPNGGDTIAVTIGGIDRFFLSPRGMQSFPAVTTGENGLEITNSANTSTGATLEKRMTINSVVTAGPGTVSTKIETTGVDTWATTQVYTGSYDIREYLPSPNVQLSRLLFTGTGAWNVANTGTGTSGQVLTSGGNSAPPSWQSIPVVDAILVNMVNNSGANVTAGTVVYVSGNNQFQLGDADLATSTAIIGLVYDGNIANGATGRIITSGIIHGLGALTPGATYYLSQVPGGFTTVAPTGSGKYVVPIGIALSTTDMKINVLEAKLLP